MSDSGFDIHKEFPCTFPIKVVGDKNAEFENAVIGVVRKHDPNLKDASITKRDSEKGHYLAITCVIMAMSKEQVDNIYRELHKCPHVKMVL